MGVVTMQWVYDMTGGVIVIQDWLVGRVYWTLHEYTSDFFCEHYSNESLWS